MRDTALVVPSIRQESLNRFITEWCETDLLKRVDLVLIEDNEVKTFDISRVRSGPEGTGANHQHFAWEDIDKHDWSWIIPRMSDTVRSFGYWWAWKQGYQFLMTLDDDCYPSEGYEELDLMHKSMLRRTRWFNTLNNVRPRGVPYRNLGERDVYINHGIWEGALDYDAPQQLVNPIPEAYTHDNRLVPHGAYFPFCGMNAMWRREAIPLSYHLLMGQRWVTQLEADQGGNLGYLEKLPFDRFGDIWCGIIQKKICDHLGWVVSTGTPYIHHDRASDPFKNLRKEANGIEVNEWLWERIDLIPLPEIQDRLAKGRPGNGRDAFAAAYCYATIARSISGFGGEHAEYWKALGGAMGRWSALF